MSAEESMATNFDKHKNTNLNNFILDEGSCKLVQNYQRAGMENINAAERV
jgi:hypothetical protein